jgi:hypothetical protein
MLYFLKFIFQICSLNDVSQSYEIVTHHLENKFGRELFRSTVFLNNM